MHNVLMRPRLDAVGLPRRKALIEVKSALEYGGIVPLGRAPETKDTGDDEVLNVSPDTQKLFRLLADELKAVRDKGNSRHDELQRRLDEALMDAKRPITRGAEDKTPSVLPKAWNDYIRYGVELPTELKALSAGSGPDGGYTVPSVLDNRIIEVARNRSTIRQIAKVVQITGGMYEQPINPSDITSAWVGEQTARPGTTNPQLAKLVYPVHEMYAMPSATQTILDDSSTNIEEWLASVVNDHLSRKENTAFVVGDGAHKPKGFMDQTFVANASWTFGSVGFVVTGDADNFIDPTATVLPTDALINLVYALKAEYRANATFVMNSTTAGIVRKLKDAEGRYIWTDSLIAGQPSFLLGYPVAIAEDMPDVGSATFPVAFGDFLRGYLIVDRIGTRILRDPYSAKPFVLFYTTRRVGGGMLDYDAIKVLKCST